MLFRSPESDASHQETIPADRSQLMVEIMGALKSDVEKLSRNNKSGDLYEADLKKDVDDSTMRPIDRAAAAWCLKNFNLLANSSGEEWFWQTSHISKADRLIAETNFGSFRAEMASCDNLNKVSKFVFRDPHKSDLDSIDISTAADAAPDKNTAAAIKWAADNLGTIGHVDHQIPHQTMMTTGPNSSFPIWTFTPVYALAYKDLGECRSHVGRIQGFGMYE
jgi:hypothetical protein